MICVIAYYVAFMFKKAQVFAISIKTLEYQAKKMPK